MIRMKASEIASVVGGTLLGGEIDVTAPAFLSSKSCTPGSIFLAIQGENVDGHQYIGDAFSNGAVLALVSNPSDFRCVVVDDVQSAISKLANHVRKSLTNLHVIGITGSQGKTTTKELLASILATRGATVSPQGNYNNELGVPLTLLQCDESTQYCVIEMGARHMGDIAALARIALPEIGIVLRVAAAHLGEFGSLAAIAQTKGELIDCLGPEGIAILGQYDPYTPAMASRHSGEILTFGENAHDDIRATDIELRDGRAHFDLVTPEGRSTVALRLYGLHQISNSLAAAAAAHALGFSADQIASALSTTDNGARWRMEVRELSDFVLVNDAYNASPDSMAAALAMLAHLAQERGGESWAFLGKMNELGESSAQEHRNIGTLALKLGVDHLVAIDSPEYGQSLPEGSAMAIHYCTSRIEALEVARYINRGDVALCKASRSEKLELLAESIEEMWNEKALAFNEDEKDAQ